MLTSYLKNPSREPHWRWLRVLQIDKGGRRASRAADGPAGFTWIRRALRLKRRFDAAGGRDTALFGLMHEDENLLWAHAIWSDERKPTRWAIEALILAGASDEFIAQRLGSDPGVIEAYEAVFFNVRERLDQPLYVVNVVLGEAVARGVQERQYDLLWKLFAYHGGIHALDAIMQRAARIGKPTDPEQVPQFFQDFAVNTMKQKAAVATLTVPVNTHTQMQLIDSFVKYVEIEKNSKSAAEAHTSIVTNIGAMLSALPFKLGTKIDAVEEKMLPYDDNAAELRNDEMLIVAAGEELNNKEAIQNLKFPGEQ